MGTMNGSLIAKKRKSTVPTGKGVPVIVRLLPDQLSALDAWIDENTDPGKGIPTRPEAVRQLLAKAFKS